MHISGIKGTAGVSAVRVRAHRAPVNPELPMGIAKPRPKAPDLPKPVRWVPGDLGFFMPAMLHIC